jgi:hypothetical protein
VGKKMNRPKQLNNNIDIAILHERFDFQVLKTLFSAKNGYEIIHNNWDKKHYSYGSGVDIRILKRDENGRLKPDTAIESKGWNDYKDRNYGVDTAEDEILDRFRDVMNFPIKICIITYSKLLTRKAQDFLTSHNIYLVEIGSFVSNIYESLKSVSYYRLKANILKVIKKLTKSNPRQSNFLDVVGVQSLVNYLVIPNTVTVNTDTDNLTNIKNKLITNKNYHTSVNYSDINNKLIINNTVKTIINKLNNIKTT